MIMSTERSCPARYVQKDGACYRFGGTHLNYDDAEALCEGEGSRLADLSGANSDYIKQQVKKLGGNDYWIGSYMASSRTVTRSGPLCPMFRRQGATSGHYDNGICNSAYPYICQKFGPVPTETAAGSPNQPVRPSRFGFGGEVEVPLTTSAVRTRSSTTKAPADSNNQLIYALVSMAGLIALAIIIWQYRKRKRIRKAKLAKAEKIPEKPDTISVGGFSTSKSNTLNKQIYLPSNITTVTSAGSTLNRKPQHERKESFINGQSMVHSDSAGQLNSAFERDPSHHYKQPYQMRSKSMERNRRHEDEERDEQCPPYGHMSRRSRRSRGRRCQSHRRARSRGRSYSGSEESAFSDTSSDSVNSKSTFKRSVRRRSDARDPREQEHYYSSRRYGRPSQRTRNYEEVNREREHRRRSQYEKYATALPPESVRGRNNGEMAFREQPNPTSYGYGSSYSGYGIRSGAADAQYFAHVTNHTNIDPNKHHKHKEVARARLPRQGPIRVNRHIHDVESNAVKARRSNDSDHIYESLDEVARNRKQNLQTSGTTARSPAPHRRLVSPDEMNGSTGSRASMRGRELPSIPN
ncbi:uncharacterized protein LOC100184266 isoform X1 [Ciona intestinalis]